MQYFHYTSKLNYYNYIKPTGLLRAKSLLDLANSDNFDNRDLTYPINLLFKNIQAIIKTDNESFNLFLDYVRNINFTFELFESIKRRLKNIVAICVTKNPNSSFLKNEIVQGESGVIITLDTDKFDKAGISPYLKIYDVEYLDYDTDFRYFIEDFPIPRMINLFQDISKKYKSINKVYNEILEELLVYIVVLSKPKDRMKEEETRLFIDVEALKNDEKNIINKELYNNIFYINDKDIERYMDIYNNNFKKPLLKTKLFGKEFERKINSILTMKEFNYNHKLSFERKIELYFIYCNKFKANNEFQKYLYIKLDEISTDVKSYFQFKTKGQGLHISANFVVITKYEYDILYDLMEKKPLFTFKDVINDLGYTKYKAKIGIDKLLARGYIRKIKDGRYVKYEKVND